MISIIFTIPSSPALANCPFFNYIIFLTGLLCYLVRNAIYFFVYLSKILIDPSQPPVQINYYLSVVAKIVEIATSDGLK